MAMAIAYSLWASKKPESAESSHWIATLATPSQRTDGDDRQRVARTKNSYYRGGREGNTLTQSSSDAPSMPSSFVKVALQRTMARPMAPIQSSFSFSVSAHMR